MKRHRHSHRVISIEYKLKKAVLHALYLVDKYFNHTVVDWLFDQARDVCAVLDCGDEFDPHTLEERKYPMQDKLFELWEATSQRFCCWAVFGLEEEWFPQEIKYTFHNRNERKRVNKWRERRGLKPITG